MTNHFSILNSEERKSRLERAEKPYDFSDNVTALEEEARQTWNDVSDLEASACPNNMAQASITMHPNFSAQADYPEEFLFVMKLTCVGVRQVQCFPRYSTDVESDDGELTVALIVIGKREDFQSIPEKLGKIAKDTLVGLLIQTIESIEAVSIYDKVDVPNDYFGEFFLVGLYQTPGKTVEDSRRDFVMYASGEGFSVHPTFLVVKDGLYYVLIKGERYKLDAIGDYCYTFTVRVPPKNRA